MQKKISAVIDGIVDFYVAHVNHSSYCLSICSTERFEQVHETDAGFFNTVDNHEVVSVSGHREVISLTAKSWGMK